MTIYHVSNDPGFFTGNVYNVQLLARNVLWACKSLHKTAGWRVLQSGDGDGIWSASDILTNVSTNNTSGPDVIGTNLTPIANSMLNYNSYFVMAPSASAPSSHQGQICIQMAAVSENVGTQLGIRARYSKGGFAAGSATVAPAPLTAGDEVVLFGGGTDTLPDSGIWWCSSFALNYWNMGVDNDVTTSVGPMSWIESHNPAVNSTSASWLWDNVSPAEATDLDCVVAGVFTNLGLLDPSFYGPTTSFVDLPSYGFAGTFDNGLTTKMGAAWLANASGPLRGDIGATEGLGLNSINSNREDLVALMYTRDATVSRPRGGGFKGTSRRLRWMAARTSRQEVDKGAPSSGTTYVLQGHVYMPYNNGVSPGVNGTAFTF